MAERDDYNRDDGTKFFKGLLIAMCLMFAVYVIVYTVGYKALAYFG